MFSNLKYRTKNIILYLWGWNENRIGFYHLILIYKIQKLENVMWEKYKYQI